MKKRYLLVTSITILIIAVGVLFAGCESGDQPEESEADISLKSASAPDVLRICSFNIQFLGHFTKKDNEALVGILNDYEIVVVQELVAPPTDGTYPDGESYSADAQSKEFFDAMHAEGFEDVLSEEDTGTRDEIHKNTSSTEWWVTFFKPDKVEIAADLPSGFLAADRSNHDDYERVPFAFAFRTPDSTMDFIMVSVHLMPGHSAGDEERRKHELESIADWIASNDDVEKDFIILGDMNIKDQEELLSATPAGFQSLNDECRSTNTIAEDDADKGKPYDHVMFNPANTSEIDEEFDLEIIDLVKAMRDSWVSTDSYPGDPYDHDLFRQYYSDHHPVVFRMISPPADDD